MLHTPIEFEPEHETTPVPGTPPSRVSVSQTIAGGFVVAFVALLVADMAAATPFVPVQLRWLGVLAAITAIAVYLTLWADARHQRRHEELLAARRPGDCCAVAWVEGLAHRPFPGGSFPVPGHN